MTVWYVFHFYTKEIKKAALHYPVTSILHPIQKATLILMGGTLLTNALSFVKSLIIAAYYGTSAELDAYALSLAPLRLVVGVLVGAFQATLIPQYIRLRQNEGNNWAFAVLGTFGGWVAFFTTIIIGIFFFGSSTIASYLGAGFDPHLVAVTASLLRISTVLLVFTLLNDLTLCLFQAHRQFFFIGVIPLLSGVCSLVYIVCFRSQGVRSLLYGLAVGMFIQACVVLYFSRQFLPDRVFFLSLWHPEVKKTGALLLSLLIGTSLTHINVVVDQIMASTLPTGSIAALHYATKIYSIFMQIFLTAISRVALPFLAQHVAENDHAMMRHTFFLTIKRTLYVLLPLTLLISVLGTPIVRFVFQRGAFTSDSTSATAGAWIAYTLGLPVQAVGILTVRVYNVLQDNKILMYVAAGGVFLNIFFNWIFMKIWGHVGIALSTSGVYLVATAILLYALRSKLGNENNTKSYP